MCVCACAVKKRSRFPKQIPIPQVWVWHCGARSRTTSLSLCCLPSQACGVSDAVCGEHGKYSRREKTATEELINASSSLIPAWAARRRGREDSLSILPACPWRCRIALSASASCRFCNTFVGQHRGAAHGGGRQVALQAETNLWVVLFVPNAAEARHHAPPPRHLHHEEWQWQCCGQGRAESDELPMGEESMRTVPRDACQARVPILRLAIGSLTVSPPSAAAPTRHLGQVMRSWSASFCPLARTTGGGRLARHDRGDAPAAARPQARAARAVPAESRSHERPRCPSPCCCRAISCLVVAQPRRDAGGPPCAALAAPCPPERKGDAEPPPPRPDSLPDEALRSSAPSCSA